MTEKNNLGGDGGKAADRRWHRAPVMVAILATLAAGAGVTAVAERGQQVTYVALAPAPIAQMKDGSAIALRGDVAEIFGNKFVVRDESGRALVETGRRGDGGNLVGKDERVTVQGRFEHGFVRAIAIWHADGRTDTLDPTPPPRHGAVRPL